MPACSRCRAHAPSSRQVGDKPAELAARPCAQCLINPVPEGFLGQAALRKAIPELGEGLFPLGIGHPEIVRATRADIVRYRHT